MPSRTSRARAKNDAARNRPAGPSRPASVSERNGADGTGHLPDGAAHGARALHRVGGEDVVVPTDPSLLPEAPSARARLLQLFPSVAQHALELGLNARAPRCHVFVAA